MGDLRVIEPGKGERDEIEGLLTEAADEVIAHGAIAAAVVIVDRSGNIRMKWAGEKLKLLAGAALLQHGIAEAFED